MTDLQKLRFMLGDADSENFQDSELQVLLELSSGSLYLAAAMGCEQMASKVASNLTDVGLGSLRINEKSKVDALKDQASRWRQLEYDMPAFAVAEENLSGFNELAIIRNWVLRTELDTEG